jgi:hypothetical protein
MGGLIMGSKEWGSIGGQVIKKRYHDLYNATPNYCLECGKKIEIAQNSTPAATKKKKFCNQSCAASYNNKSHPKRERALGSCQRCGKTDIWKKYKSGTYSRRKFCKECLAIVMTERLRTTDKPIEEMTKGDLRAQSANSHWFKTKVSRHARKIYELSKKERKCYVCGYDYHIHVSHIRDVRDFPKTALIGEINHIDNLVALCPNHHKEFDDGYINLDP